MTNTAAENAANATAGSTVVAPVAQKIGKKAKRKAKAAAEKNASAKKPKQDLAAAAAVLLKEIEEKKVELERLLEQMKRVTDGSDDLKADDEPKEHVEPLKEVPVSAAINKPAAAEEQKNPIVINGSTPVAQPLKEVPVSAAINKPAAAEEQKPLKEVPVSAAINKPAAAEEQKNPIAINGSAPVAQPLKEVPVSAAIIIPAAVEEEEKKLIASNGSTPAAEKDVVAEGSGGEDDSDGGSADYKIDEEEPTNTLEKAGTDVKMSDAEKDAPTTPTAPKSAGSKTLFAGNLSFQADEVDVRDFFGNVCEIVEVRIGTDKDGIVKGYGHVEFASEADAVKALEFNGKELMGRPIRLDIALSREESTPKVGSSQETTTVFVKGFGTSLGEEEIRNLLQEQFGKCGEIARLSIPMDNGVSKGIAFIYFKGKENAQKALALDNTEVGGFQLTVNAGRPKSDLGGRGKSGGRFGSGGRNSGGRFGHSGRGRGGRGGGGRGRGGRSGRGHGDRARFD